MGPSSLILKAHPALFLIGSTLARSGRLGSDHLLTNLSDGEFGSPFCQGHQARVGSVSITVLSAPDAETVQQSLGLTRRFRVRRSFQAIKQGNEQARTRYKRSRRRVTGTDRSIITWKTGWTTKITKDGDHYKKAAFGNAQSLDGPPANSLDAEKVK
jgi:hypothetical protein